MTIIMRLRPHEHHTYILLAKCLDWKTFTHEYIFLLQKRPIIHLDISHTLFLNYIIFIRIQMECNIWIGWINFPSLSSSLSAGAEWLKYGSATDCSGSTDRFGLDIFGCIDSNSRNCTFCDDENLWTDAKEIRKQKLILIWRRFNWL